MKKVYSIEFNFTQTLTGEAFGETEEEVVAGLQEEFGDLPNFLIVNVTELGEQAQLDMNLEGTLQ